jgi:regulator of replication initiation timing
LDRDSRHDWNKIISFKSNDFKSKLGIDSKYKVQTIFKEQVEAEIVCIVKGQASNLPSTIHVNPEYLFSGDKILIAKREWLDLNRVQNIIQHQEHAECIQTLNNQLTLLTKENGELKVEVRSLQTSCQEQAVTIQEQAKGIELLNNQVTLLTNENGQLKVEILALKTRLDACLEYRLTTDAVLKAQRERIDHLSEKLFGTKQFDF